MHIYAYIYLHIYIYIIYIYIHIYIYIYIYIFFFFTICNIISGSSLLPKYSCMKGVCCDNPGRYIAIILLYQSVV